MALLDYHVHTNFSADCNVEMAAACEAAISRGLGEIAFCDHAEFRPLEDTDWCLCPSAYLNAIEGCRRRYGHVLAIRAGIELGEPHFDAARVVRFLSAYPFDMVIGSLHHVGGLPNYNGQYFAGRTLEDGVGAYFDELARLATSDGYDVLGHFDIVRRAVHHTFGPTDLDYTPYAEVIRRILRALVNRGKGLEVNTAVPYRGMGDFATTLQVLRWYREMGGEILTIGSDAHTVGAVGACFSEALDAIRAAGFARLARFEDRQLSWVAV